MASLIMTASGRPTLLSLSRIATLACSTLVALSSGTNYVYSAYAPQLGSRLQITHTQLNIVGLAANFGTYAIGPITGRIVDSQGPRLGLAAAFVLLFTGYSGIWKIYDAGLPPGVKKLSTLVFCVLAFCSFMTGVAGNAGLSSAINSTAKSFPDRLRGTTTAIVLSGFGLSAFFFSAIANAVFPGKTSSFLLVLALGTSLPMILGFFFVRPIPLPPTELGMEPSSHSEETGASEASAPLIYHREDDSRTGLLAQGDTPDVEDYYPPSERNEAQQTLLPDHETRTFPMEMNIDEPNAASRKMWHDVDPNISGLRMWITLDFWLLFMTMSSLAGTGLMYINNVGSISQALLAKANPNYDDHVASRWQVAQVSTVSITNCVGRIVFGLAADLTKNRLGQPRTCCLIVVSILFILSQISCLVVTDVRDLWQVSALLGLAYGGVFGLVPTLTIEHFGLPHFSENWGFMSLSPLLGGNAFSLAFGRNLDAHSPPSETDLTARSPIASPSSQQCFDGRECYASSLHLTVGACMFALILSMWATFRDRRKIMARGYGKVPMQVVWEGRAE